MGVQEDTEPSSRGPPQVDVWVRRRRRVSSWTAEMYRTTGVEAAFLVGPVTRLARLGNNDPDIGTYIVMPRDHSKIMHAMGVECVLIVQ